MCHEVISISKSKQKQKKDHYDDIFLSHGSEESIQIVKSNSKLVKKGTYSQKIHGKISAQPLKIRVQDDFDVGQDSKPLNGSDSSNNKSTPRNKEQKEPNNIQNDSFDVSENDIDDDEELVYHGMSPDEITLVDAAKKVGYEFRYRSNNEIEIKIGGVKRVYKLLEVFKFTSERKRMTVIVQDPDDPEFVIAFIKGADNIMKSLSYSQFQSHFDFT